VGGGGKGVCVVFATEGRGVCVFALKDSVCVITSQPHFCVTHFVQHEI